MFMLSIMEMKINFEIVIIIMVIILFYLNYSMRVIVIDLVNMMIDEPPIKSCYITCSYL